MSMQQLTRGVAAAAAVMVTMASTILIAQAAQNPESAPRGNADTGKQLFNKIGCYACHGNQAQGSSRTVGPTAGPRLAPFPMPFRRFAQYIRAPRVMPPYTAKVASEQDLADIYAFLMSVPPPPDVDSIPLLAPSQFVDVANNPR